MADSSKNEQAPEPKNTPSSEPKAPPVRPIKDPVTGQHSANPEGTVTFDISNQDSQNPKNSD